MLMRHRRAHHFGRHRRLAADSLRFAASIDDVPNLSRLMVSYGCANEGEQQNDHADDQHVGQRRAKVEAVGLLDATLHHPRQITASRRRPIFGHRRRRRLFATRIVGRVRLLVAGVVVVLSQQWCASVGAIQKYRRHRRRPYQRHRRRNR